jgi:hypothetical protein
MHQEQLADPVMALGATLLVGGAVYLYHGTMVVHRERKRVLVALNYRRLSRHTIFFGLVAIGGGIGLLAVGHWGLG